MHLRTSKLAKTKFRGCIHVPRFNRGGSEKGERAGVERRRGEGKEKVEGMMEGRGGRKAWKFRWWEGIAPLLLGGIDATVNLHVAGRCVGNSLPSHTRTLVSRESFGIHLKTHFSFNTTFIAVIRSCTHIAVLTILCFSVCF